VSNPHIHTPDGIARVPVAAATAAGSPPRAQPQVASTGSPPSARDPATVNGSPRVVAKASPCDLDEAPAVIADAPCVEASTLAYAPLVEAPRIQGDKTPPREIIEHEDDVSPLELTQKPSVLTTKHLKLPFWISWS